LDLKDEDDLNELYEHIKSADIVISNFKEKSAQQLKVDYQTLKSLNATLIFAHLKGFPDNDRVAFDIVLQAETGFLYMNGEPNRPPVRMPVALIDLLAAHQLKEAILVGLINRYKTGEGCQVSTSLYEAAVASLANQATNWLMAQHIPQKMGTQHPNIAPYGDMFQTKDGKSVVLAIGTNRQFTSFCKVVGLEKLLTDERFIENSNRVIHRTILAEFIADKIQHFNAKWLLNDLNHAKVPIGIIRNMQEVFEVDAAQSMILKDDEGGKRVKTVVFEMK
jgi:crotonobetainyl-CoA:carnitine CoA-transferase CaiB-like acyl-CoA transferase